MNKEIFRSPWRERANAIINKALQASDDSIPIEVRLRKISRECYPFGERAQHPYKIWLSEIKRIADSYKPVITEPADYRTGLFKEAGQ